MAGLPALGVVFIFMPVVQLALGGIAVVPGLLPGVVIFVQLPIEGVAIGGVADVLGQIAVHIIEALAHQHAVLVFIDGALGQPLTGGDLFFA